MFSKIWNIKREIMMKREKEYDFPEFLRLLRNSRGVTRKIMCEDIGISRAKLLDLEHGHFLLMPKEAVLITLAEYYEIEFDFMKRKCEEYCQRVQSERKQYTSFYQEHPEFTPKNVMESQNSQLFVMQPA